MRTRLLLPLLALLFLTACKTSLEPSGIYQGDAFLYQSEQAIVTGHKLFIVFLEWERDYRPFLAKHPEVTAAADTVRLHLKEWETSAHKLHDAYVASPTEANKNAMEAALRVLKAALDESTAYLLKYNSP